MKVYASSLFSEEKQSSHFFYDLPFCKPSVVIPNQSNIGDLIINSERYNTFYIFKTQMDINKPIFVCTKTFTDEDLDQFEYFMENNYKVTWMIDSLPAAILLRKPSNITIPTYTTAHKIGYINHEKQFCIYNHLSFMVDLKEDTKNHYTIVGFQVLPKSIPYIKKDDDFIITTKKTCASVYVDESVSFSYDVHFRTSVSQDITIWNNIIYKTRHPTIHWFTLTNNLFMILFVTILLANLLIYIFTNHKAGYNLLNVTEIEQDTINNTWKLIFSDVFRPPTYFHVLCVLTATGIQLALSLGCTLLIPSIPYISQYISVTLPSDLIHWFTIFYLFFSFLNGYITFYILHHYEHPSSLTLGYISVIPFSVLYFVSVTILHLIWIFADFQEIRSICIDIPQQSIWTSTTVHGIIVGLVTYLAIYYDLFTITDNILHKQTLLYAQYSSYSYFMSLCISTGLSLLLLFSKLSCENYEWWWSSYIVPSSIGIVNFVISMIYFTAKYHIKTLSALLILTVEIGLISIILSIIYGGIGFFFCFQFVKTIYGTLRID
ncbi:hypothetical protein WA158_008289 [Blastocystis sp. Blastoise]